MRYLNKVPPFLIVAAGADDRYFGGIPAERTRAIAIGGTVCFTAATAAISFCIAITMALDVNYLVAVPAGLVWGAAIFNIDRWLVGAPPYGGLLARRLETLRHGLGKSVFVIRLLVAAALGIIISEPLVLRIYRAELSPIVSQLNQEEVEERSRQINLNEGRAIKTDTQLMVRRNDLERTLGRLNSLAQLGSTDPLVGAVTQANLVAGARQTDKVKADADALAEYSEGKFSGTPGVGDVTLSLANRASDEAKRLATANDAVTNALKGLAESKEQLRTDVKRIEGEIATGEQAIRNTFNVERRAIKAQVANSDGFLRQQEALDRLVKDKPDLRLRRWAPSVILVAIDVLPVLLKLMSGESVHDLVTRYKAKIVALQAYSDYEVFRAQVDHRRKLDLEWVDPTNSLQINKTPPDGEPSSGEVVDLDRSAETLEGQIIALSNGAYELVEYLASGGTADLFLAIPKGPPSLNEGYFGTVIKVLRSTLRSEEATILERVRGSQVVHLLGSGQTADGKLALAFRYYPRMSLDRYLFSGVVEPQLDVWTVYAWLHDLIEALGTFWVQGIVHADGKPENVIVTGWLDTTDPEYEFRQEDEDNQLKIVDFGEAFVIGDVRARPGFTSGYMPPEVAAWGRTNRAEAPPHSFQSDAYSFLGGVTYYVLSGGVPPVVEAPDGRHVRSPMDLLVQRNVPAPLVTLVETWLSNDPAARTPTVIDGATGAEVAALIRLHMRMEFSKIPRDEMHAAVDLSRSTSTPTQIPKGYSEGYLARLRTVRPGAVREGV